MCGRVASPTPTVPILSDSTSSMDIPKSLNLLDKPAAVIHPAVPPPTIQIFLIFKTFAPFSWLLMDCVNIYYADLKLYRQSFTLHLQRAK